MERIPYGKYTKEFREEAVRLVVEGGLSIPEAGRRLSLASSTLSNWVRAHKAGKLSEVGGKFKPLGEKEDMRLEAEIEAAHKRTRRTCGNERLQKDLAAHGVRVGIYHLVRSLKQRRRTRYGYPTLRIYRQMKGGYILPGIRIYIPEKLWGMQRMFG